MTTSFSQGGSHQEINCAAAEGPATIDAAYVTDQYVDGNGFQGRLFEHDGLRYFEANTGDEADREPLKAWFSDAVVSVGCEGRGVRVSLGGDSLRARPQQRRDQCGLLAR